MDEDVLLGIRTKGKERTYKINDKHVMPWKRYEYVIALHQAISSLQEYVATHILKSSSLWRCLSPESNVNNYILKPSKKIITIFGTK